MSVLEAGQVRIDLDGYQAAIGSTTLDLSRLQRDLLVVLAEHAGDVVTYEQLAEAGWGRVAPLRRPICNAVHSLRVLLAKGEDVGDRAPAIAAVATKGYIFDPRP